jgi:hypothetical protein
MTPTETIAVKLFGWKRDDSRNPLPDRDREYTMTSPTGYKRLACIKIATGEELFGNHHWPDLADWNDIRRMEDAMAAKEGQLFRRYCDLLTLMIPADDRGDKTLDAMRSSPAQRVAACLRVLQDAGL